MRDPGIAETQHHVDAVLVGAGLPRDERRMAVELDAGLCDRGFVLRGGHDRVDVALDCTSGAGTLPILLGVEALKRKGGTIVVQGEMKEFPSFPLEKFTVKFITMKSARGHSYKACELALEQIASKRFPLELITTHKFGLKDVDLAIKSVGGHGVPDVIHASLMPWL